MDKELFKSGVGEIHFGVNKPTRDFSSATKDDVKKTLANLKNMRLWRCTVCNDLHIGLQPPKECPTCSSIQAYVEINLQEFGRLMGL
ncbi:hypothetical protein HY643_05295 [Candidatus Woesearchaeota archaeon]|nr:hypothetical protein [Candidatus Woesearchaeota archaeon]